MPEVTIALVALVVPCKRNSPLDNKSYDEILWPDYARLEQLITKEQNSKWIDDIRTDKLETFAELVYLSFENTIQKLSANLGELSEFWQWGKYRGTDILHLAKIPGFGVKDLFTGGGKLIPNATRDYYGPSWRFIVEMTTPPKAMGILPGGQSGYPGSKYYDNMVEDWRVGELLYINSSSNPDDIKGTVIMFNGVD